MQVVQGSLVIISANTQTPQVMWNGRKVEGLVDTKVNFNSKVTLKVKEANLQDQVVLDLIGAGVVVKGVK